MTNLPRLIATDLDGTLVRSDGSVSARSHDVLRRLAARGVAIVGITGRGPRLLKLCEQDVPTASALVLAQGGFVFGSTGNGEMSRLRSTLMHGSTTAAVVRHVEAAAGPLTVVVENDPKHDAPLMGDFVDDWPFPVPIIRASRDEALAGTTVKTYLRSDSIPSVDLLSLARQVVPGEMCALTEAGIGFVEVCPPGIDKGSGLQFVASHFGVPLSETLVFGDALNDLPMFALAGRSVAMKSGHPDVRGAADEVAAGNDADGVADYLERLLD